MGWKIFVKAIRLVLDNFGTALRLSAIPYLLNVAVGLAVAYAVTPAPTVPPVPRNISVSIAASLVVGLVGLVAFAWIAVGWHRYILLDEKPSGIVPRFQSRRVAAYVGYSFLLAVVAVAISIAAQLIAVPLGAVSPILVTTLVIAAIGILLVLGYRLSLVLPASSVGRRLGFGESWRTTQGALGTMVVLALVSAVAAVLISLPGLFLVRLLPAIGILWQLVVGWVDMIVGISILTTLYGYFVEHRAID